MQRPDRRPRVSETLAAGIILLFLSLLFWKVRIIDLGVSETPQLCSGDIYAQHYPMTEYAFASLRSGRIPLWNPYQLCGDPFLAIAPYVGLFYPLNLPYLFSETGAGTEIGLILHMFFGAMGMWCLLRHFKIGALGGICAAVTFVWSGWLMYNVNQPSIYNATTWMPLTVLLFDRAAAGGRLARLGVVVAIGCQTLLGAAEVFLHVLYVAGLFAFARLIYIAWFGQWRAAVRNAGILAACGVAGVLLGAVQLLPTLELVHLSPRGAMSFEQVSSGSITPQSFLEGALEIPRALQIGPILTVGVLPLLGLTLVLGFPKRKLLWITALVAVAGGAFLALGGWAFRLYYALLVIGHLFRRPVKFLDIYTFGLAVLAGVALSRLESWAALPRRRLWLHPAWLVTLALGGLAAWWAQTHIVASLFVKGPSRYLPAMLALLVLFGLSASARWRRVVLVGVCTLQGASLFFVTGTRDIRPWQQRAVFTQFDDVLQILRERADYARSFVFGHLGPWPLGVKLGMMPKLMRNRVFLASDYEPLVEGRYASYFDLAAPRHDTLHPFAGVYNPGLDASPGLDARWRLLDLAGTEYFLAYRDGIADAGLRQAGIRTNGAVNFQLIRDGFVRIYAKTDGVLPRAYFVPRARIISDPAQVLETLLDPSFHPRTEVILEVDPGEAELPPSTVARPNEVNITSYEPEQLTITAEAQTGGFLVLTDLFYPGWKAFVNDREVTIFRANYLFRAVHVDPGSSVVRFEYRPASFRFGATISVITAAVVAGIGVWTWRRSAPFTVVGCLLPVRRKA